MDGLIAVFGGTFDPPHIGHLILADEARASLGARRVLWVVTAAPPHKPAAPSSPAGRPPRCPSPGKSRAECEALGGMRRPGAVPDLAALETQIPGLAAKLRFV